MKSNWLFKANKAQSRERRRRIGNLERNLGLVYGTLVYDDPYNVSRTFMKIKILYTILTFFLLIGKKTRTTKKKKDDDDDDDDMMPNIFFIIRIFSSHNFSSTTTAISNHRGDDDFAV